MKLGPRVAIIATLLMAAVLAAAMGSVLVVLRGDQLADLDREAHALADAIVMGLEPLPADRAGLAMKARVAAVAKAGGEFRLEAVAWGGQRPNNSWAGLVEEATKLDAPVGRLFDLRGIPPFYAMAIPLHNAAPGEPKRQVVAFLGLVRDGGFINQDLLASAKRLLPLLGVFVAGFAVAVYVMLMRRVATPLRRLVDAIDGASKGDLSRAVLPERDDEIGSLAGRFNAMMNYLREAREKEARATAARVATEAHLRHAEKLATVGQMAAEIAHEVGTPLNVIGGRARTLARRSSEQAEVEKNAEIISTQVDRITKSISQVLDYSRKNRPTTGEVDVAKTVRDTLEFVEEDLKKHKIEVALTCEPELRPIPGNADEIQQVCLNLIMNAVHAMAGGGKLGVVIEYVIRRKEGLDLAPPAPYLMIAIADTGPGVPQEDRARIFEAFFTTKDKGEGTGLGLAVSHGIVKDHDGFMEVGDSPGGGAVFRVFLPLPSERESDQAKPDATPPPQPVA
ncbi:MAG: HAMP domain-containing protein [Deltaproteobacteria bacterium]|nr:HAMP domain-containing protein [Deltaproteobacteria bacterium]